VKMFVLDASDKVDGQQDKGWIREDVSCWGWVSSMGKSREEEYTCTDELTDGNCLGKMTLQAGLVLPTVVQVLTSPEELCNQEEEGGEECAGKPP
jgi:hypothetical protein